MLVIDYLNDLAEKGLLISLCQAGLINTKRHSQREIYLHYQALATSPHYIDKPLFTAVETAAYFGIHITTVYKARAEMLTNLHFVERLGATLAKAG